MGQGKKIAKCVNREWGISLIGCRGKKKLRNLLIARKKKIKKKFVNHTQEEKFNKFADRLPEKSVKICLSTQEKKNLEVFQLGMGKTS